MGFTPLRPDNRTVPVVAAPAKRAEKSHEPAAALIFPSPVGYQTNMMVYGPGGYRFADSVRLGLSLSILLWTVGTMLIPIVWPFNVLAR